VRSLETAARSGSLQGRSKVERFLDFSLHGDESASSSWVGAGSFLCCEHHSRTFLAPAASENSSSSSMVRSEPRPPRSWRRCSLQYSRCQRHSPAVAQTAVTGKDRKNGPVVGLFDQPSGSGWSLPTCIRLLWTAGDVGYLE
jgi:hypothetical protein